MSFREFLSFTKCPPFSPLCKLAQWAETVISRTFGDNFGKKSDIILVESSLEAYYEEKQEKMTKSEIWSLMGDWGLVTKFTNFWPKSF